ncbi:hypothetical protein Q7C36_018340 [Tachysurus vachellii]|uniref:Uncharacterized protein n=1 Tax=Tachysurus vachellii TaxID=175792 RepID=A0AA88SCS3_TACVA|nr:hypothetical protein Q7C36_018340 [Tachysurus vachellii]
MRIKARVCKDIVVCASVYILYGSHIWVCVLLINYPKLSTMWQLMLQHILLGMTAMLLTEGGSAGNCSACCCHNNSSCVDKKETATGTTPDFFTYIGLSVLGFLILLSLACHCTTCIAIMCRKVKPTVPDCQKENKEQTRVVVGEEELCYATVKFTGGDKDSDHLMKFGTNSEYATVVINTDPSTPQLD